MRKINLLYALAFLAIIASLVLSLEPINRVSALPYGEVSRDTAKLYLNQQSKPIIQATTSLVTSVGTEATLVFEIKGRKNGVFWKFIGLPSGLRVIDSGSKSLAKVITGLPITTGTFGLVVNVSNKSGKVIASANFPIIVNPAKAGDFNIQLAQSPPKLKPGQSTKVILSTTAINGFQGDISLSAQTVQDLTASFSNTTIPVGSSSELVINASRNARAGTYEVIINGRSGSLSRSLTASVVVEDGAIANPNPKIITLRLPNAVINQAYSTKIEADANFDPNIHRFTFISRDFCAREKFINNTLDPKTGDFSGFPNSGAICSYEFRIVKANEPNVVLDSTHLFVLIPETIVRDFPASVAGSSFRIGDTITVTWNSNRIGRTTVYLFNFTDATPFGAISVLTSAIGVVEKPSSGQNSIRWNIPPEVRHNFILSGCVPERFVVRVFITDPASPIGLIFTQTDEFKIDF